MRIAEIATTKPSKPQTPDQARVAGLKAGVDRARDALKAERERQRVQRAQQQVRQAVASVS